MFYTFGEQYAYDLLYTVARAHFPEGAPRDYALFQSASRSWLRARQPWLGPVHEERSAHVCTDPDLERRLVEPLYKRSYLDDMPQYRDPTQLRHVGSDRERIAGDAAHVVRALEQFRARDEAFWKVFHMYVDVIACVESKYSSGGTSSEALGVVYLSHPRKYSPPALYEILAHEVTHLMMFVDERRQRHYRSDEELADPANFCVSAVYEMERPLDKTLHSLIVATEVILHREHTIGHGRDHTAHPRTPRLVQSSLRTADALLELQARRSLLAPRGVAIVERCRAKLEGLLRAKTAA